VETSESELASIFVLARIVFFCIIQRMIPITLQEFARLGGKARSKKLTKAQRSQAASKAAKARWKKKAHN
jgi:hypothetical protein